MYQNGWLRMLRQAQLFFRPRKAELLQVIPQRRIGFPIQGTDIRVSLVEILVALGIIGLLVAILLPAVQWLREAVRLGQLNGGN